MLVHPKLAVFEYGFLQDAANLLTIMEREGITLAELKESVEASVEDGITLKQPKARRGFLRRTTKAQRRTMQTQKGMQRRPCTRCDEKRRGKK